MAFLTISQLLLVVEKQECHFHRGAAGTCKICASGAAPLWAVQLQAWATSLRMAQIYKPGVCPNLQLRDRVVMPTSVCSV